MGLFAKVFSSLWEGSMIAKPDVQLVFVFLLAHADREGFVNVTHERIGVLCGLGVERVRAAIDELEAPDTRSRSPEQGGRRLIRLEPHRDWGWQVVNYGRYRAMRDEETRREQSREAMRRLRAERAGSVEIPLTVSDVSRGEAPLAYRDVDVDLDTAKTSLREVFPGDPAVEALGAPIGFPRMAPEHGGDATAPGKAASVPAREPEALRMNLGDGQAPASPYSLPLAGGAEWQVPPRLLVEWQALYPAVSFERAFSNMRGYLLSNGKRRPTARGAAAFVNNWLRGDQDRASRAPRPARGGVRRGSDARYGDANVERGNG
jgi:hypothetical protein